MRSALYEWPFAMRLLWEYRCIIDVLLEGIMGLMVAGDFATVTIFLSCSISEIQRGIGRKSSTFTYTTLFGAPGQHLRQQKNYSH